MSRPPPGSLGPTSSEPQARTLPGFIFMASTITTAQTCNVVFASLLPLRLSTIDRPTIPRRVVVRNDFRLHELKTT